MDISKVKVGSTTYNIKDITARQYTGTVTGVTVGSGGTNYTPTNGVVTIPAYPTTLPASDVSAWAKESSKPSYSYSEIGYTVNTANSAGGTVTVDATIPIHVITLTGNVSAVTFSNATSMIRGHSCHVVFYAAAAQTVVIANKHTSGRYCPNNEDITLEIPAGGYVEVDVLCADGRLYIRGV